MILEKLAPIKAKYLCHYDGLVIHTPVRSDKKIIGHMCSECGKVIPEDKFQEFVNECNKIYQQLYNL